MFARACEHTHLHAFYRGGAKDTLNRFCHSKFVLVEHCQHF